MRTLTMLAMVFGLSACSSSIKTTASKQTEQSKTSQQWIDDGYTSGIIKDFSSLDGCGFLILIEPEQQEIMPSNLAVEFQKESLQVWIKYHNMKAAQTTCMKGQSVHLDDIHLK